jgi:hypothetical protein
MNERIQDLIKQATEHDYTTWDSYNQKELVYYKFNKEKFAELIVLEMCNVLDRAQWDNGQDWICADGTRIIPQIKEHFGVE